MSGPVAIPHRGDPGGDYPNAQARPGQTAPVRIRSGSAGITTMNVPMPLGALQGGRSAQRERDNPWMTALGSDHHPIDPAVIKSVALPRRGLYGSDVHPQGPARRGGARGPVNENEYEQIRRGDAVDELIHDGLPGAGRVVVGLPLGMHAPPSEYDPRRPYYENRYAATHYQAPTQYSPGSMTVIAAQSNDPGRIDRKRLDQWMWREMYGNSSQRFLPPVRDRFQRFGSRWLSRSTGTVRPQMVAGPGHKNQLMLIPPAQTFGEQSQYLEVM